MTAATAAEMTATCSGGMPPFTLPNGMVIGLAPVRVAPRAKANPIKAHAAQSKVNTPRTVPKPVAMIEI